MVEDEGGNSRVVGGCKRFVLHVLHVVIELLVASTTC